MDKLKFMPLLLCLALTGACASSSGGTTEGSTGSVALSLEMEDAEATYSTADDFTVTITEFALCLASMTVDAQTETGDAVAEFAVEEAAVFYELDGLDAGNYGSLSLAFCQAGETEAESAHAGDAETVDVGEMVGNALFIRATASDGTASCDLTVLLDDLTELSLEAEETFAVDEEETAEIIVHVDPTSLLEELSLAEIGCADNASVTVDSDENAAVQSELEAAFSADMFEVHAVEEESGHHH